MTSGQWSDDEIGVTVHVYFRMLTLELGARSIRGSSSAARYSATWRSPAAIEYQFNNVSAVRDEMDAVWIPGYKLLRNVQQRLRTVVQERFDAEKVPRSFMLKAVADLEVVPSM